MPYKLKTNEQITEAFDKEEELAKLQEKCKNIVQSNKKLAMIIIKEWNEKKVYRN